MSTSSPARLYCTLVGAVLVIAGIIGFFYSSGFDTGVTGVAKDTDDVFGILAVNGWHNIVHILLGVLALVAAGSTYGARDLLPRRSASSTCCSRSGASSTTTAVILGLIPLNDEDNVLHLILGLTGLAAGAATPKTDRGGPDRPSGGRH